MTHFQYPSNGVLTLNENCLNRRSQSFLAQTCTKYPLASHLSSTQSIKQPPAASLPPLPDCFPSHSKENFLRPARPPMLSGPPDCEAGLMRVENERLRQQLQQQKELYEQEISRLKKNIAMKDQLLDECEAEIGHLKTTYHKFIAQNAQNCAQTRPQSRKKPEPPQDERREKAEKISAGLEGTSKADAGLIPLSIVPKRSSSASRPGADAARGKLSHGLIRRAA